MLEALKKRYEAQIAEASTTIQIYLKNSVGIGEHPQHLDEIDKLLEKIVNESDEEALINYVGEERKWSSNTRQEKKNALLNKKDEIISKFITNKKLFGVNLTDYSRTITKEITDEQREKLNSYLSSKELKVISPSVKVPSFSNLKT